MIVDKFREGKSSPFIREKASYRPWSPSDDEIYAEIEQPRSQGLLLFSIYKDSSLSYISKRPKDPGIYILKIQNKLSRKPETKFSFFYHFM